MISYLCLLVISFTLYFYINNICYTPLTGSMQLMMFIFDFNASIIHYYIREIRVCRRYIIIKLFAVINIYI